MFVQGELFQQADMLLNLGSHFDLSESAQKAALDGTYNGNHFYSNSGLL